jgi:hypothetical protein
MAIGKVGGSGKKGAVQGGGASGKASGTGFSGRIDKTQSSSSVAGAGTAQAVDPISNQAAIIAQKLRSGEIKSREEATRKLVAEVLKEKVRMHSQALTEKISQSLQDDPRISAALERLWAKVE